MRLQNPMKPSLRGVAVMALTLGIALPAAAQPDSLRMLGTLAKGEWTLKMRDGSGERKICLRSGNELIQLRHQWQKCNRIVVEDEASEVTVHYTCSDNGFARTNIRRETSTLVQIESQGIAARLPFEFAAEARRTGTC